MAQELQAFDKYMQLVQSGMPFSQALQESGLSGLNLEQQKKLAAQQQQQGMAQVGGTLVGALGTQAIKDVATGQKVLGGLREGAANIGKEISGLFGSSAPTGIGPVASGADYAAALESAGQAATQTANQAATVTPPAETGMFAPGSTLGNALGGAGVALGAYGAYKGIENKDPLSAGLGGLGLASGLSQLGLLGAGPLGWAGIIAAPAAAALINKMGDKDRWKEEYNRKKKLVEEGIIPESMLGEVPTAGRSKEQLVALEEQKIAQGQYGNPEFAKTRDVSALKPQDIWGFSVAPETLGKDYMAASEQQRLAYNQKLLEEGLVKEAKGQISYTDPKRAKEIWAQVTGTQSK